MAKNSKTQTPAPRMTVETLNALAQAEVKTPKAQAKAAVKTPAKAKTTEKAPRQLVFLGKPIDFGMADVEKKFAKVKDEDLGRVKSYHVAVGKGKNTRQIAIPTFIEKMLGIKLEWRTGQTGNPVGTYSTGNAAKFLKRAGFDVRLRDGKPLEYVAPERKTPLAGTKEMAEKMAKLRAARDAKKAETAEAAKKAETAEAAKKPAAKNGKKPAKK